MKTFTEAVQEFENASPWLEPKHTPALVMLYAMAKELDAQVINGDLHAPLMGQYGLAYRNLSKEAPKQGDSKDEMEEFLRGINEDK
jgi:hypothetical protein